MTDIADATAEFQAARAELIDRKLPSSAAVRSRLSAVSDAWVTSIARSTGLAQAGAALVAVGGYGRGELCAQSDLDLLLLLPHNADPTTTSAMAEQIWYPIWDAGLALDHSVRDVVQCRKVAQEDLKVVLGLLDARTVAGDDSLVKELRTAVLNDWRTHAKNRLVELKESVDERRARVGELPHLLEPDLKEAYGGIRESTVLRAIAASWLTDIDHAGVAGAQELLLDVRDGLHRVAGRATDRLSMHDQAEVGQLQSLGSDDDVLRAVFVAGRTIAVASDLAWHRVGRLTRRTGAFKRMAIAKAERTALADGVVLRDGEAVLARDADAASDPVLGLRAAAAAAQAGVPLSPATVEELARNSAVMPHPWPQSARDALVSLLGAGAQAIPVWEALDQAGIVERLLPEWNVIRAAPQRNALHTYTVDRHSIECAAHAATLARNVGRPDLLLVGALFHDIGKARGDDHCGRGEVLMQSIAPSLGFNEADCATLSAMVKHHLLIPELATRRDIDDPATISAAVSAVGSHELLDLLHNLTIADSKATGPGIWSDWKATLVGRLVDRVHAALSGDVIEVESGLQARFAHQLIPDATQVTVGAGSPTFVIHVSAPDRVGLLETIAAALSVARLEVRSAHLDTVDGMALQEWEVSPQFGESPAVDTVRSELLQALKSPDLITERALRLTAIRPARRGFVPPPPRVRFLQDASARASVLEVRAHDAPALLFRIAAAVADLDVTVTAARVLTLGSEVVDVLYLRDSAGLLLPPALESAVADAVAAALVEPAV